MADVSGRVDPSRDDNSPEVRKAGELLPVWKGTQNTACLSLSQAVYSLRAIHSANYKFSDRCAILVDSERDDRWLIFIVADPKVDLEALIVGYMKELGDQQLRQMLEAEFGATRTLIVAQAFSEGNLLDPERDGSDDRIDPKGTGLRR